MSDNGKHGHAQLPIPNGWFAAAWSKDLVDGEVKRTRCFGEELVMFRTRGGNVRVLDAYCAHLGAHLGEGGRVIGENLRCPFHGWTYDGGGKCVEIPYCKEHAPPAAARVRSWPVVERNRMIFVWHHAEGLPPSWDVPVMPEIGDPNWTEPRLFELEVPVHMQDMAENNCDPAHFHFVHGNTQIPKQTIEYGEGGRFMRVTGHHETDTLMGSFKVRLDRDCWGLGLAAVRPDERRPARGRASGGAERERPTAGRRGELRQLVRVLEVIAAQANHVTPRDRIARGADVHQTHAGSSGFRIDRRAGRMPRTTERLETSLSFLGGLARELGA